MTPDRLVPFALVGVLAAVEIYAASRSRPGAEDRDRGSLRLVQVLTALGYMAGFTVWSRGGHPRLGEWALWVGAVLALAGLALRVWSILTLGRYFTIRVNVSDDQPVIEAGPYRLLRHPSYTGAILAAAGIGLTLRHPLGPLLCAVPQLLGLLIRIPVEERALVAMLGEPYRAYMTRTKRLIPFVW